MFKLTLKAPERVPPVELIGFHFDAFIGRSIHDVRRMTAACGNHSIRFEELFDVEPGPDDELTLIGDCRRLKYVGAENRSGRIRIVGDVGMHLAERMSGGEIIVEGNVDDDACLAMSGGLVRIRGDAGARLGSANAGEPRGMTGGTIVVDGDVGDEAGAYMRRGLIAVGGTTGSYPGVGMIAGLLIAGRLGRRAGASMKRGTLAQFSSRTSDQSILPTFRLGGRFEPGFLGLTIRQQALAEWRPKSSYVDRLLERLRGSDDRRSVFARRDRLVFERWSGDFLELGQGEILFPEDGLIDSTVAPAPSGGGLNQ
jgi:formylmethanofuran dehydrogenase subunit C